VTEAQRPTTFQLALRVAADAALAYSENPALRAVLAALPFISGLDALAGTAGSNIALERVRTLIEVLAAQIERVADKPPSKRCSSSAVHRRACA